MCYKRPDLIPFIRNAQNRQIRRDREWMDVRQGLSTEGRGVTADGHKVSLWGDEKVLKPDRGGVCTIL